MSKWVIQSEKYITTSVKKLWLEKVFLYSTKVSTSQLEFKIELIAVYGIILL